MPFQNARFFALDDMSGTEAGSGCGRHRRSLAPRRGHDNPIEAWRAT
jgi:hypothetical protein